MIPPIEGKLPCPASGTCAHSGRRIPGWIFYLTCVGIFIASVVLVYLAGLELLEFALLFPAMMILSLFGFMPHQNLWSTLFYAVLYAPLFFCPLLAERFLRKQWIAGIILLLAVAHCAWFAWFVITFEMPVPSD